MRKVLLTATLLIAASHGAHATDDFNCTGGRYQVYMGVGTTGSFGNVLLFEEGKKGYKKVPRADLQSASFDWEKKYLNLKYTRALKGIPKFEAKASGNKGSLTVNGARFPLKCDWDK